MNDISHETYKNFSSEWKLVTIRYRKDTEELRFTYANQLAFEALKNGNINYPDGAIFAKLGMHTTADSEFESSVIPNGIHRYQYMVKDAKKYSQTNGWGYALFDNNGVTFPEDPVVSQNACHACHTLVSHKGYVFSENMPEKIQAQIVLNELKKNPVLNFKLIKKSDLPLNITKHLPKNTTKIQLLVSETLEKNVFQGTLDELKPTLIKQLKITKMPTLFIDQNKTKFIFIHSKSSTKCKNKISYEYIQSNIDQTILSTTSCEHD